MNKIHVLILLVTLGVNVCSANEQMDDSRLVARPIVVVDLSLRNHGDCNGKLIECVHIIRCYEEATKQYEADNEKIFAECRIHEENGTRMRLELNKEREDLEKKWPVQRDLMQMNPRQQTIYLAERDAAIKLYKAEDEIFQKKCRDYGARWENERKAMHKIFQEQIEAPYNIITQKFHEEYQRVFEKFKAIAIDIAKGMNAVLLAANDVLYIDHAHDITQEVIDRLNKEYLKSNQRYKCNNPSCGGCSKI